MKLIAFLGAGRMASAIVQGLLSRKVAPPSDLRCLGAPGDETGPALARRTGIQLATDPATLLDGADTLVLACKPQQLATLDPVLADLAAGRLVVSILAGKRLDRLHQAFPRARALVRAMPNTPGQIGAGITAWSSREPLSDADRETVGKLLGALGSVLAVGEEALDAITGLSGSGPAFVFEFVAALRDGGVAAGLSREVAAQLAQETVLGAARLLAQTGTEPEALRDQVTSPNGTTFAGLEQLQAGKFRDLIRDTILAATARSRELSREE